MRTLFINKNTTSNIMKYPLFKVFMSDEAVDQVSLTLKSGMLTQGKRVEEFEEKLRQYFQTPYLATLNSATAGLTLAMRLLMAPDLTPDSDPKTSWPGFNTETDVVLTPALTCFATTTALLGNNVNLKWLDVNPTTANIDLTTLSQKLTPKTKIIYLVHWAGVPVDLDKLDQILEEAVPRLGFKPRVVEDCAHSFGTKYNDKPLGNHGNICVFSFQAIKQLTTADGGLIILPTEKLHERALLLRWFGIDRNKRNYKSKDFRLENDITEYGYKFHMNDVNATLGIYNLPHIDKLNAKALSNAQYYNEQLNSTPGLKLLKVPPSAQPVYWLYTLFVDSSETNTDSKKREFMTFMQEHGIMTSQVHNRNDTNSCVKQYQESLPNLDIMENELVCIPVGWWITTEDRKFITEKIKEFFYTTATTSD